jgi:hypothetical protein
VSEEEGLSLFLKRNIPDATEDYATHMTLTQLWESRQAASTKLVEALNEDDSDLFDTLEEQMRQINQQMHRVYKKYLSQKTPKSDEVHVVPSNDQHQIPNYEAMTSSHQETIYEEMGTAEIQIKLDYNGIQVIRRVHGRTQNRVVYHLAQQYLREVFALQVANLSDLLLLHNHHEMPIDGSIDDIPILDGEEIMVMFRRWGSSERTQRQPDLRFHDEESDEDSSKSEGDGDDYWTECWPSKTGMRKGNPKSEYHKDGTRRSNKKNKKNLDKVSSVGDHADHHREERHDLNHARAPSQPGTNGGAFASARDVDRHYRRERNELSHFRASSQPGNNGGVFDLEQQGERHHGDDYRLLYDNRTPHPAYYATPSQQEQDNGMTFQSPQPMTMRDDNVGSRSFDKIRQSFKCPKFTGQCKEWKQWTKGFMRYLSIWELEYVLDPEFLEVLPLTPVKKRDNKMVYFIIEDAVQHSPLAASYVRQASVNNGFEAYYTLHDGFVFAGMTTATLLLNELSNFRFLPDETPTALCLRLEELFEELELLPGNAAVTFVDTQRIGYLVNALRHESEWDNVCSAITSAQIKGDITFRQACNELRFRCETSRAHELLDKPLKGKRIKGFGAKAQEQEERDTSGGPGSGQVNGLISTMSKRQNSTNDVPAGDKKTRKKYVRKECLAAECDQLTTYSLCSIHYHSLISGKTPVLKLRNGYGDATYDGTTSLIVYPARTPTDRLPPSKAVKASLADTKQ